MSGKIYHYCSIQTFEQILKTKLLRFTELNFLKGRNETTMINGKDTYGKCFVSCWTDSRREQLGMWENYTNNKPGVRIGIPKNLFNKFPQNKDVLKFLERVSFENQLKLCDMIPEFIFVTYTKDESLLNETSYRDSVISKSDLMLRINQWGRFKSDAWKEQSECRFKVTLLPKYPNIKIFDEKFLNIPFDVSQLENMKVTLSPLNTMKANEQVYRILSKHVDKFLLKTSDLNF